MVIEPVCIPHSVCVTFLLLHCSQLYHDENKCPLFFSWLCCSRWPILHTAVLLRTMSGRSYIQNVKKDETHTKKTPQQSISAQECSNWPLNEMHPSNSTSKLWNDCVWLLFVLCNWPVIRPVLEGSTLPSMKGCAVRGGGEWTDLVGWERGRAHRVVWLLQDGVFLYVEAVPRLLFPSYLRSFYSPLSAVWEKWGCT